MPIRALTPEEEQIALAHGLDPSKLSVNTDLIGQDASQISQLGAIKRTALAHGGSYLGGGAGMMGGATIGAELGALGGPAAPITIPVGGIIGGLIGGFGGGYAGGKAQKAILPAELEQRLQLEAQQAAEQHPYTAGITDIAGNMLAGGMRPSISNLKDALLGNRQALAKVASMALINPAIETGMSLVQGQGIPSGRDLALSSAGGALFSEQSSLGKGVNRRILSALGKTPVNYNQYNTPIGPIQPETTQQHVEGTIIRPFSSIQESATKAAGAPGNWLDLPKGREKYVPMYPAPESALHMEQLLQSGEPITKRGTPEIDALYKAMEQQRQEQLAKNEQQAEQYRTNVSTGSDITIAPEVLRKVIDSGVTDVKGVRQLFNKNFIEIQAAEILSRANEARVLEEIPEGTKFAPKHLTPEEYPAGWMEPNGYLHNINYDEYANHSDWAEGKGETEDTLKGKGWARYLENPSSNVIYFDTKGKPTIKQLAEAKNLAIEKGYTLKDGDNNVLFEPDRKNAPAKIDPNDLTRTYEYSPEDLQRYKELKARYTELAKTPEHPDLMRVAKDFENLRNKYGGNQPRQIAEPELIPAPKETQDLIASQRGTTGSILASLAKSDHPVSELAGELAKTMDKKSLDTPFLNVGERAGYTPEVNKGTPYVSKATIPSSDIGHVPTILHEIIHTATSDKLPVEFENLRGADLLAKMNEYLEKGTNPAVKELIQHYKESARALGIEDKLFINKLVTDKLNIVVEHAVAGKPDWANKLGLPYGMGNLHEFIAEAFSNREFQKTLDSIKTTDGTNRTLWQKLVQSIRNLLGLSPSQDNMLDRVLRSSAELMKQERGQTYFPNYEGKSFLIPGAELVRNSERALGLKPNGANTFYGSQLLGSLKNKLSPTEWKFYEDAGIVKEFQNRYINREDAAKWMEEHTPKAVVHTYGMEGKVSEAKKEYDKMTHEWYETLGQQDKQRIENAVAYERHGRPMDYENELAAMGNENAKLAQDYLHYKKIVEEGPKGLKATSYYKKVSALLAEKNARDLEHDNQTINWLAKQPQHIRDEVEARLEKAAGGARMEDVLKQHKQDAYAKGSERENEVTSNNPEHYIERNYDGSYYVNQNPHVGIADTRIPGKRYATKDEAIQAARKLHRLLSEADNLAINKYVDATLKQEESGAMPWWTRSAIEARKGGLEAPTNVQRVDVVIPKKSPGLHMDEKKNVVEKEKTLWPPDNLHENLPNTLGWAMIQYKTGPKGERIAVIAEAQSRWGQEVRTMERGELNSATRHRSGDELNRMNHPLLRDYNRLILKAAIDQARKEGATHIMVSDAETAMMTEGHDLQQSGSQYELRNPKTNEVKSYDYNEGGAKGIPEARRLEIQRNIEQDINNGWKMTRMPEQAPGMRLNYDTILPKIAEELTGSKGEKVSLGEHKNSRTKATMLMGSELRKDLIFRNSDGTSKTDVSGRMYDISNVPDRPPNLFGTKFAPEREPIEPKVSDKLPEYQKASFLPFLTSRVDKIAEKLKTPTANYVSQQLHKLAGETELLTGRIGNRLIQATKDFTAPEINKVYKYLHDIDNTGKSPIILQPTEQHLATTITEILREPRRTQIESGLLVKQGKFFREAGIKPEGYIFNVIDTDVVHTWQEKPNTPEAKVYNNAYLKHLEEHGISPDEAKAALREYKLAMTSNIARDVEFGALRKAEGVGLPWELIDKNFASASTRYGRRAAADLAYFKYIQNDPKMLKALNLRDQFGVLPKAEIAPDIDEIGGVPEVQNALRSVFGIDKPRNPTVMATARLAGNMVMGVGTAARNVLNMPAFIASYVQIPQIHLIGKAIANFNNAKVRAFENNAVKASFLDFDAAGFYKGNPSPAINLMNKFSQFLRKYQGRDFSDRFEGEFYYSLGEQLATDNIARAKLGNKESLRFIERFGDIVDGGGKSLLTREVTQDDISRVAKRMVDAARGTYTEEGQPSWAIEGELAPFAALSRFAIEKSNTIWKDVIQPARQGIYGPLLRYTLASFGVGALIEKLNEELTNKRGQDPTIKEVWEEGNADDYVAKTIGLLQLSTFAGSIGDAAKLAVQAYKGKSLQYNQPLSFPLYTLITDTIGKNISDATDAIKQGEDPIEVLGQLVTAMSTQSVQTLRYMEANFVNPEEAKRKEKFRDLRIYNELQDKPVPESGQPNQFENLQAKRFKRTGDINEAIQLIPSLVNKAFNQNNPELIMRSLQGLKQNSYNTMPSMEHAPIQFSQYYDYLRRTQGDAVAQDRLQDYIQRNTINKVKSSMVP